MSKIQRYAGVLLCSLSFFATFYVVRLAKADCEWNCAEQVEAMFLNKNGKLRCRKFDSARGGQLKTDRSDGVLGGYIGEVGSEWYEKEDCYEACWVLNGPVLNQEATHCCGTPLPDDGFPTNYPTYDCEPAS